MKILLDTKKICKILKSEILGEVLDKTSKFNYENYTKNDILKALDTQIEP